MNKFWNEEHIFKIGRLVFAHVFDDQGYEYVDEDLFFDSEGNSFCCTKLFWKIYWITN